MQVRRRDSGVIRAGAPTLPDRTEWPLRTRGKEVSGFDEESGTRSASRLECARESERCACSTSARSRRSSACSCGSRSRRCFGSSATSRSASGRAATPDVEPRGRASSGCSRPRRSRYRATNLGGRPVRRHLGERAREERLPQLPPSGNATSSFAPPSISRTTVRTPSLACLTRRVGGSRTSATRRSCGRHGATPSSSACLRRHCACGSTLARRPATNRACASPPSSRRQSSIASS